MRIKRLRACLLPARHPVLPPGFQIETKSRGLPPICQLKKNKKIVYDTLDSDIADYLRENNPNPGGHKHHHQLFNDLGYKDLMGPLMSVIGIMRVSADMDRLKENLATALNTRTQRRARLEAAKSERIDKNIPAAREQLLFDILPTIDTAR